MNTLQKMTNNYYTIEEFSANVRKALAELQELYRLNIGFRFNYTGNKVDKNQAQASLMMTNSAQDGMTIGIILHKTKDRHFCLSNAAADKLVENIEYIFLNESKIFHDVVNIDSKK